MPELPEVETIARGLNNHLVNKQITAVDIRYSKIVNGDEESFRRLICGLRIKRIYRYGKYLFLVLSTEVVVSIHLRMSGQLFLNGYETIPDKHTHLDFYFQNYNKKLSYRDIRKFGRLEIISKGDISRYIRTKKLGPDALEIDHGALSTALKSSKRALKALLLDQSLLAGLGNIYVDEALFLAGILPFSSGNKLTARQIEKLFNAISEVLQQAIKNRGTTLSDFIDVHGKQGSNQFSLMVYGRAGKPCPKCRQPIIKTKVNGRGTHYCAFCQR